MPGHKTTRKAGKSSGFSSPSIISFTVSISRRPSRKPHKATGRSDLSQAAHADAVLSPSDLLHLGAWPMFNPPRRDRCATPMYAARLCHFNLVLLYNISTHFPQKEGSSHWDRPVFAAPFMRLLQDVVVVALLLLHLDWPHSWLKPPPTTPPLRGPHTLHPRSWPRASCAGLRTPSFLTALGHTGA